MDRRYRRDSSSDNIYKSPSVPFNMSSSQEHAQLVLPAPHSHSYAASSSAPPQGHLHNPGPGMHSYQPIRGNNPPYSITLPPILPDSAPPQALPPKPSSLPHAAGLPGVFDPRRSYYPPAADYGTHMPAPASPENMSPYSSRQPPPSQHTFSHHNPRQLHIPSAYDNQPISRMGDGPRDEQQSLPPVSHFQTADFSNSSSYLQSSTSQLPPPPTSGPSPPGTASDAEGGAPKRIVMACRQCRARKIRCDADRPSCKNCLKRHDACVYDLKPNRRGPDKIPGARMRSCKSKKQQGDVHVDARYKYGQPTTNGVPATTSSMQPIKQSRSRSDPNTVYDGVDEKP